MTPHIPHDKSEVFILESLTMEDEQIGRMDGALLSEALRLYGKSPKYYYFRTERELEALAEDFSRERYKYLHLSCHGSASEISTTYDSIGYGRFAEIFKGRLNNKRFFASSCSLGNDAFSISLKSLSGGLQSVLAPSTDIGFSRSAAFWPAFYFLMFDIDRNEMKLPKMKSRLLSISSLFKVDLHLSWNSAHENKLLSMNFSRSTGVTDEREKSA